MDPQLELALAQLQQRQFGAAQATLAALLSLRPDDAQALHAMGVCLVESERPREALPHLARALALAPALAPARLASGTAHLKLGEFAAAAQQLRRYLEADPANPYAWNSLALALKGLGELDGAEHAARSAIRCRPDFDFAHSNLANILFQQGRFEEARAGYGQALRINPANALTRWNLGLCRLMLEDWPGAWTDLEARWLTGLPIFAPREFFHRPWWRGEDPAGLRLFLHAEQGLGDALQFSRYVPELARRGARIVFEVPAPLRSLMRASMPPEVAIIARADPVPDFDRHAPLMSIPLALGTRPATVPAPVPYLKPGAQALQRWRERLDDAAPRARIAVAWSSGLSNPQRDVPLHELAPLIETAGGGELAAPAWLGLQTDLHEADRAILMRLPALAWLGPELRDFEDTAAVLAQCDLVVTVDTALAHLAGALGKPVWILLPRIADWRWQRAGERSLWYPSARLFRQDTAGQWSGVVARARQALREWLSARNASAGAG